MPKPCSSTPIPRCIRPKIKAVTTASFFKREMNIRAVERQAIEMDLRRALENGEFVLHYQPKVNLANGRN